MARKFWERVGGNQIRFYDEPVIVTKDEALAEIIRLNDILGLSREMKEILVASRPDIESEEAFDKIWTDQIQELADKIDYWDFDTVQETIDVIDSGWFKPVDGVLGPGVILAVCGEEVGNEAGLALDGLTGTNWQHDHNHDGEEDADENPAAFHDIVIDLGYKSRIDGIKIQVGATPGDPLLLSLVNVFVSNGVNGLQSNPASHVGVDLEFSDPADIVNNFIERDLVARSGRFIQIRVGATAHVQNHITLRDFQIRKRARTFGL